MPAPLIRLLGRPEIEIGGEIVDPPRGQKAWAVLAYLALAELPVSRAHLARMVFGDAEDPLGALRWTLAELRRVLAVKGVLEGDPLRLSLPEGSRVDAVSLDSHPRIPPNEIGGELLEGIEPKADASFDAWLLAERRRLTGVSISLLHDAGLEALARGRSEEAVRLATRALVLDPYDESMNELAVRALVSNGAFAEARERAEACDELFRRELGRPADSRIMRAADAETGPTLAGGDPAAVKAQLEAGEAALAAGAVEPGMACLRQACTEARSCRDPRLLAEALVTLGVALVHAVRGRDEEGLVLLHEALALSEEAGDAETAGRACRQLGYVDVQAGRTSSASRWLERAHRYASRAEERAAVLGIRGMALSDRAHYESARELLRESVSLAEGCADERQAAWSRAILARVELLCGNLGAAGESAERSLSEARRLNWFAFQPLPEALGAEVRLRSGDIDGARRALEHAFLLSCRLGDPCWEALAARARGLVSAAEGDESASLGHLEDAVSRSTRVADPYVWITAYCLDALAGVAIESADSRAEAYVVRLEELAGRSDMRELVARASVHRARLGDRAGLASARELADAIANPLLDQTLSSLD